MSRFITLWSWNFKERVTLHFMTKAALLYKNTISNCVTARPHVVKIYYHRVQGLLLVIFLLRTVLWSAIFFRGTTCLEKLGYFSLCEVFVFTWFFFFCDWYVLSLLPSHDTFKEFILLCFYDLLVLCSGTSLKIYPCVFQPKAAHAHVLAHSLQKGTDGAKISAFVRED